MNIIMKKVSGIIPYINNPRKNDGAVDKVASSIKNFGFKVPIVIDKKGEIVTGHTRVKAAKKLGIEEVPTIVADDLTDAQIKAFRIADNRVAAESEWDFELLQIELDGIDDFSVEELGFDVGELKFNTESVDYSDFEADNQALDGEQDEIIYVTVPARHAEAVRDWLSMGEGSTGPEVGRGVMKRCGLL